MTHQSPRGSAGPSTPQTRHPSNVRYVPPEELRRIFNGPATPSDFRPLRNITVKTPIDWRRISEALIIAVLVGNAVFWIGQLVRLAVQQ